MQLDNRFLPGCAVVDVVEERLVYPKTVALKSHVLRLLEEGHRRIVLNLEKLDMIDSFGLAVLISLLKLCRERTGNFAICNLSDNVTRLVELTHMEHVLTIYPSESQAVKELVSIQS